MTLSRRGRYTIGWLAAALLPAAGTVATEQGGRMQHLHGDYGLTTVSECLRSIPHPASQVGIDPATQMLLLPTVTTTQSGSGVMHFTADGRAQFSGRATEVDLSVLEPGQVPSIPGLTLTCQGTQTLTAGNQVTLRAACTVVSPQTGASFMVAPVQADGTINDDGTTIELNEISKMQTIQFSLPDGSHPISERVCTQRFTLVKIS